MREQEALPLLFSYAKEHQKLLVELGNGDQIYCFAISQDEEDPDDWGFNFKVAPESEGIEWMHGTKIFVAPCSDIVRIETI